MWVEPCRFTVKEVCLGLLALCVCVCVLPLCVENVCWFLCLHPCLTMCCLFATVYIYYSVPAFKADHSREQSVFIALFVFFHIMLQGTALCTLILSPLSLSFRILFKISEKQQIVLSQLKTICPKIHFKIAFTWLHSSIIPAAVECLLSSQSIHSQWQHTASLWTENGPFKHQQIKSMGSIIPIKIFSMLVPNKEVGPSELTFNRHKREIRRVTACLVSQASVSCPVSFSSLLPVTLYSHLWWLPLSPRSKYSKERERSYWLFWPNFLSAWSGNSISHSHRKCHSLAQSAGIFSTLLWKCLMGQLWL